MSGFVKRNSIKTTTNTALSSKQMYIKEIKEFMNYKLAFEKMFESNLRLVIGIAAKYKCNIDMMDLIQEGNSGLIKAIVGFDASLGNKFSTYATTCIHQKIRRYINRFNSSIRLPEYVGYDLYGFKKNLEKLKQQENKELLLDEIAEKLNLPVDQVRDYLSYMNCDISLDESISDYDDLKLGDTILSDDNVEETVMSRALKEDIYDLLSVLNERYQDIIKMKFGLGEYNGELYTTREIGKKYSISPQRVTEIFHRSLYLMKRAAKQNEKQKSIKDYY